MSTSTDYLCSDVCGLVIGPYLLYRDRNHLSTTISTALSGPLGEELSRGRHHLARPLTPPLGTLGAMRLDIGPKVAARVPAGFDERRYERFGLRPCGPTIGAEIEGVDLGAAIDDELQAELRRALLEWKVLFFRQQSISREQQRTFAAAVG